jgi:hypothetical protein
LARLLTASAGLLLLLLSGTLPLLATVASPSKSARSESASSCSGIVKLMTTDGRGEETCLKVKKDGKSWTGSNATERRRRLHHQERNRQQQEQQEGREDESKANRTRKRL